jgi:hypothetical protein
MTCYMYGMVVGYGMVWYGPYILYVLLVVVVFFFSKHIAISLPGNRVRVQIICVCAVCVTQEVFGSATLANNPESLPEPVKLLLYSQ